MTPLFIFIITYACTALHGMDYDNDESDCIITMHSEEDDSAPTRNTNNPAPLEPTSHYLATQITAFNKKFTLDIEDSDPCYLVIKHNDEHISIDPDTVSFDSSGAYAYGRGSDNDDDNDGFYYCFSYPACIMHTKYNFTNAQLSTRIAIGESVARLHTHASTQNDSVDTQAGNLSLVSFTTSVQHTITASLLHKIPNYHQVTYIDLSHNELAALNLATFNCCADLSHLDVSHNKIETCAMKNARLRQLHTFSIAHNQIKHIKLDTILGLASTKAKITLDISNNPLQTIDKPTKENRSNIHIICNNIPADMQQALRHYAVSTKESFKEKLKDRMVLGGLSGLLFTLTPLCIPKFASLSAKILIGLSAGTLPAGMLCTASTAALFTLCCSSDEELFHDHYSVESHNIEESDSEIDDSEPLEMSIK